MFLLLLLLLAVTIATLDMGAVDDEGGSEVTGGCIEGKLMTRLTGACGSCGTGDEGVVICGPRRCTTV